MLKLLAFGAGTGAGFQAWRNFPPDGPVTGDSLALVFGLGIVAAFLGGLWRGRGRSSSTAFASASANAAAASEATATQTVNLAVVVPGAGARAAGVSHPGEGVPWLGTERPPVASLDDLDGQDIGELLEVHSQEEAR